MENRILAFSKPGTQNGKQMKGQAAIEYLMTYGWAILVIAIVIVALYMMTQTQIRLEQCTFPPGFMCNDPLPQVFSHQGKDYINLKLHNKQAQAIEVSGVLCTTSAPQDAKITDALDLSSSPIRILPGSSESFMESNPSIGQMIPCKSGVNPLTLSPGQDFKGYIIIWYNYENDIDKTIKKTVVASVTGTILQG